MHLQYLKEESGSFSIFCRGHNKGCPRKGAARDNDDGVDLYCVAWLNENPNVPVEEAPI